MVKVEVSVPEVIKELYKEDRDVIILEALRHVVFGKRQEKEEKLKEATGRVEFFEKKHKQNIADFQKNMPLGDEVELHEDWVEWSYWVEVQNRLKNTIKKMETLYEASV